MDVKFEQAPGVGDGQGRRAEVHGVTKSQTLLSDWAEWLKATLENSLSVSYKLKLYSYHMIQQSHYYVFTKENENSHSHRSLTPMFITSLLKIAENLKQLKVL